ncbi:hydrolase [Pseudothauera rhizosphaerae]|uniref:Hydrolase n=1 Tax=Pseudothauera rhizosphaerae TaxID=2565932 RepID=A0A4S4A9Q3_9RHOO|nr:hydrolase [Pseudothauera rhizosphaerae]THF55599.1 hydrolase [Pseudothauera rhizosphaerae]
MSPFRSPAWLPGGHAQTIWPLARKGNLPALRRERWTTPDGDFIDLDWLDEPAAPSRPLVALFHGLEGSSRSHYARALLRAVAARGWRGVVPHFRGCSGEPNRLARAYHSGDSDEINWILRRLAPLAGSAPLFAAGVSLGGNALLKWLGERGEEAARLVASAAAVCPPLDLTISGHALGHGFNRLYSAHFLATLRAKALAKHARHPGLFDAGRVRRARNLYEFDDAYTGPVHGFDGAADYWRRASSKPWLPAIRVPTLLLNAANDPFVPPAALPQPGELSAAVRFECPPQGGHVGFLSGAFPGHIDWLPQRLLQHFDTLWV